jgi:hypothetical protein
MRKFLQYYYVYTVNISSITSIILHKKILINSSSSPISFVLYIHYVPNCLELAVNAGHSFAGAWGGLVQWAGNLICGIEYTFSFLSFFPSGCQVRGAPRAWLVIGLDFGAARARHRACCSARESAPARADFPWGFSVPSVKQVVTNRSCVPTTLFQHYLHASKGRSETSVPQIKTLNCKEPI